MGTLWNPHRIWNLNMKIRVARAIIRLVATVDHDSTPVRHLPLCIGISAPQVTGEAVENVNAITHIGRHGVVMVIPDLERSI